MKLIARDLGAAPGVATLASRLVQRPGFACLWPTDGSGAAYLGCDPVTESNQLDPEMNLPLASRDDAARSTLANAPRWIGLLPYEAFRGGERPAKVPADTRPEPHVSRPCWRRYAAVARVTDRVLVIGDDPRSVAHLSRLLLTPAAVELAFSVEHAGAVEPGALHAERIRRVRELISLGEVYQVNVARRLTFRAEGHPLAGLMALSRSALAPFAAALAWERLGVVSTSPELCLQLSPGGQLVTCPIKGTRPRGADAVTDHEFACELDNDPKERAELTMVIDVERNDLSRVAKRDSVRLVAPPRVVVHRTVLHRQATVGAWLRPDVSRRELLEAMLPSGSVTGAPKLRAMEIIAELETARRGLYTGAYGTLCHDGSLTLAMAIRMLTMVGAEAHYFVGGGIVADSDPEREVTETLWKSEQLLKLLGSESQKLARDA